MERSVGLSGLTSGRSAESFGRSRRHHCRGGKRSPRERGQAIAEGGQCDCDELVKIPLSQWTGFDCVGMAVEELERGGEAGAGPVCHKCRQFSLVGTDADQPREVLDAFDS